VSYQKLQTVHCSSVWGLFQLFTSRVQEQVCGKVQFLLCRYKFELEHYILHERKKTCIFRLQKINVSANDKSIKCHICGIGFSKKNLIPVRINCVFFVYYLFSLGNCFFIGTRICNAVLRILVVYPGSKLSPSRVLDLNFLPIRDP
jgi:hypothetical protein